VPKRFHVLAVDFCQEDSVEGGITIFSTNRQAGVTRWRKLTNRDRRVSRWPAELVITRRQRLLRNSRWLQFHSSNGALCSLRDILYQHRSTFEFIRIYQRELRCCCDVGRCLTDSPHQPTNGSGIPLGAAVVTRIVLFRISGPERYQNNFIRWIGPLSLIGPLFIIIFLFASQGLNVVNQITLVFRVAVPLVVYFTLMFLAPPFSYVDDSTVVINSPPCKQQLSTFHFRGSRNVRGQ
jgi:Sodium Bile acid symporter family